MKLSVYLRCRPRCPEGQRWVQTIATHRRHRRRPKDSSNAGRPSTSSQAPAQPSKQREPFVRPPVDQSGSHSLRPADSSARRHSSIRWVPRMRRSIVRLEASEEFRLTFKETPGSIRADEHLTYTNPPPDRGLGVTQGQVGRGTGLPIGSRPFAVAGIGKARKPR